MLVGAGWRDGIEEAHFGPSHLICSSNKTFSLVCFVFCRWQTASSLKTRLNLMLETIRALPSPSSIIPTFDHMAVDTSWERKTLKKVTWLQIPGRHAFVLMRHSKCC